MINEKTIIVKLLNRIYNKGEDELIPRLVEDAFFLEEMYQKYHLQSCE